MLTALFVLARVVANPVSNVFQKQLAQRGVHPLAVIGVTHALLAVATLPLLAGPVSLAQSAGFWANIAACATGAMQLATLLTFGQLQVGYSLALFQLSALLSLFLGHRYFREGRIRQRLLGTLVMIAGALLISLLGKGATP